MKQKVYSYIKKQNMVTPGSAITVALSGGADSVALLHLLLSMEKDLHIAVNALHVEHGIRGEESLEDARFVSHLCDKLGVELKTLSVDVPAYAKEEGLGLEEAARKLRYKAFAESGASRIALAHHRDDQAETVLFQMARGSGLKGLTGIAPVREDKGAGVTYIRPLLQCSREEIEAYLASINQPFRTDSTNTDEAYSRNHIRHSLLPEMNQLNSAAGKHLADTADHLRQVEDYMSIQTAEAFAECCVEQYEFENLCGEVCLSIEELKKLHPALAGRVLRQAIMELTDSLKDVEAIHIESLLALIDGKEGSQIQLPYLMKAYRDEDQLVLMRASNQELYEELSKEDPPLQYKSVVLSKGTLDQLKATGKSLKVELEDGLLGKKKTLTLAVSNAIKNDTFFLKNTYTKSIAYDKIKSDLVLRSREDGDWFYLNQAGDRKNVNREFIDKKIPEGLRPEFVVVSGEDHVYAILGGEDYEGRVSYDMYVDESTEFVLTLTIN